MAPSRCPECGGRLAATRTRARAQAEPAVTEDTPAGDETDAPRVDPGIKSSIMVCQDCGATLQAPDL